MPARCQACGRALVDGEDILCMHCVAGMTSGDAFGPADNSALRSRFADTLPIVRIAAMDAYTRDNAVARLIKTGKYDDNPARIIALARIWAGRLVETGCLDGVDALQPVPMHMARRLDRGYNQAGLIAREISRLSHVPVIDCLRAPRAHRSQAGLSAAERRANASGFFRLVSGADVAGRHIALVDDVITTGATLGDAAACLAGAGAGGISIFALAATPL